MHSILQVGLGPLGLRIAADLLERRLGDVVAAVDSSPEIAGRKLSELVPGASPKVSVRRSLEEVREWRQVRCAIVATSSDLARCVPTFRELLGRGVSVVSTCEELCWPWLRHETLARELDVLARDNRAALLGTGVNPGFLMDAFPLAVTAVSRSVRSVEVHRFQDASHRRVPFQRKIGVGLDQAGFDAAVAAGTLRHVGLGESLHFLAQHLGLRVERWSESLEPVKAGRDRDSALGRVEKGRVCGVRQVAEGFHGEERVVRLEFIAALGLEDPHDRVIIEGEPPIDLTFKGGVQGDVATSSIVLNAIGPLLAAAPGLHTMASIPLVGFAPPLAEPGERRTAVRRNARARRA